MPKVDPHVLHILWIEKEEIGMTGFVRNGYDTFPPSPPFVHALSLSLEETGTDQTNPTF